MPIRGIEQDWMETFIALFRGINVGGNNLLPMDGLKIILEGLGLQNVKTYIQSGNVIFRTKKDDIPALPGRIVAEIKKQFGFEPRVLFLNVEDIEQAIALNPFPEAEFIPQTLHVFFLVDKAGHPDLLALENIRRENERFKLQDQFFYLHAPDGIGRSSLAANAGRLLGVPVTGRNWSTVLKIAELAREVN